MATLWRLIEVKIRINEFFAISNKLGISRESRKLLEIVQNKEIKMVYLIVVVFLCVHNDNELFKSSLLLYFGPFSGNFCEIELNSHIKSYTSQGWATCG